MARDSFIDYLRDAQRFRRLIGVQALLSDEERFTVGGVTECNEGIYLLSRVNTLGYNDGIEIGLVADIQRLTIQSAYLDYLANPLSAAMNRLEELRPNEIGSIADFLGYAHREQRVITLIGERGELTTGLIQEIGSEVLLISCFNTDSTPMGMDVIQLSDIGRAIIGSVVERQHEQYMLGNKTA